MKLKNLNTKICNNLSLTNKNNKNYDNKTIKRSKITFECN